MIYLLRHGQTDWNLMGRMQGQTDIMLNQKGIADAHNLAQQIVKKGMNKIISSDLKRARQTAEIINSYLNVPLLFDKRLREIGYGDIEGLIKKDIPLEMWEMFNNTPEKINAESFAKIYERIHSFFYELDRDEETLIVTHGGAIRMMLYLKKYPHIFDLAEYQKSYQHLEIQNTTLIPWD